MRTPVIFLAFANDKVDNARYLRNLPLELDGIRKALRIAEKENLCEIVEIANATIENILDTFQDERYRDSIAIFHYGGHADGYQLLLEQLDGSHSVAQGGGLVSFFSKQKGLKLVFFNGCSTHQQSTELLQAGIPAVIGTSNAINDDIATDLSIRFYKGIAQGMTLESAWNSAIDEVKIKKGEANTRGLYRKEAAAKMEDERFPWELLIREGAEIVKEFNLPSEVNNLLFGLPEISQGNLPASPYQSLTRYDRTHAEVFFGRARYIRDLYNRITDKNSTSIITIGGQAGVGKSSLFDAGLVPRLEQTHVVKYMRRSQDKGLLGSLEEALGITKTQQEIASELASVRNAMSNSQVLTHSDNTTTQLIEQLKILAGSANVSVQSSILKIIEEVQKSNELGQNLPILLTSDLANSKSKVLKRWQQIEHESGKPLVIILDQVEESYTRPRANLTDLSNEEVRMNIGQHEVKTFLEEIKKVFENKEFMPKGKLLLGFRKEFQPDFEEWFRHFQIPHNKVFIDILKREEIIEIIEGLTSNERLRRNYCVSIETSLPEIIADDLLEDKDSAVAPVLQLIMTKLWKSCEQDESRFFTTQKYQDFRREGLLMADFVDEQLAKIKTWNPKIEESGLVLDILMQHTTRTGIAGIKTLKELEEEYAHVLENMLAVLEKAKELDLLVDLGERISLAHDELAPVIQEKYHKSMAAGQRAIRLLENKVAHFEEGDKKSSVLDERELGVVEEGNKGMRIWTSKESALVEESKKRRKINQQKRRWQIGTGIAAIFFIIAFAVFSWYLRGIAKEEQTRTEASQLLTLALQNNDLTMALRLAERADSLAKSISDNTLKNRLIEIASTNNFYSQHWKESLGNEKICTDDDVSKFLFLDVNNHLILKDKQQKELFRKELEGGAKFDLSPDGKKILAFDVQNVLKIWDLNGKQLLAWQEAKQASNATIYKAGFFASGTGFYVFLDSSKVNFFDFKGREVYSYVSKPLSERICNIALSDDGEQLALLMKAIPSDALELRIINTQTKQVLSSQKQTNNFKTMAFSPNGEQILWVSDTTISLQNTSGEILARWQVPKEQQVNHFCFSADGKNIWTTNENKTVRAYQIDYVINSYKTSPQRRIFPFRVFKDETSIQFIRLTANHQWLLTVNQEYGIKFWNLENNYKIFYGGINEYPITSTLVSFSPDGKEFYSRYESDVLLKSWQINPDSNSVQMAETDLSDEDKETTFKTDGKHILRVSDEIQLLDFELRILAKIPKPSEYPEVFLSDDSEHIIVSYHDTTQIFDREGKTLNTIKDAGDFVLLSPNNQYLLITNIAFDDEKQIEQEARLWDAKSGELIQLLKGHKALITSACFSPDSKYLATVSEDKTAKIWNIQGETIATLRGHTEKVNAIAFSPTSSQLLTGSEDYTARLWDINGQLLKIYTGHKVKSLAFSPNGTQFVSSGWHEYDQKDLFNISMDKKTVKILDNPRKKFVMNEKHTVSSVILWDINQDQDAWLKSNHIAKFSLPNFLEIGASIPIQTLFDLEKPEELNKAGVYFLESEMPISGVPNEKRLDYAKKLFEKSLEITRTKEGVIGMTNIIEQQSEEFDVEEMENAKDTDELHHYIKYVDSYKLKNAIKKVDSLKYWQGMKKIAKKSLSIKQTPQAFDAFNRANAALGETKENIKIVFSNSAKEMREFAQFFSEKKEVKKQSLQQAKEVFEYMFKNLKSTPEDYRNAANVYHELANLQLFNKEIAEAEKSVKRGLELHKNNIYLLANQMLIYISTQRETDAKNIYQQLSINEQIDLEELKRYLINNAGKLEKIGLPIEQEKVERLLL